MSSGAKTRDELWKEVQVLRARVAELEAADDERERPEASPPDRLASVDSGADSGPSSDASGGQKVVISGIPIEWDREQGTCTVANEPAAIMWIHTTLEGLMSGLQAMVGTERFALALQSQGRRSVEDDWKVISRFPDFRSGFEAIGNVSTVVGWGNCQLESLDEEKKTCRFRIRNSWEGRYQKARGSSWGSGLLAGKTAGLCSKLFETNCWAEQTASIAEGDEFDEFVVAPSTRSVEEEIENLLATDEATRADMAVALHKLRTEISERERAEETLAGYRDRLEELVEERTQQLEQSRTELRHAERLASVGTLAAGMAHQINNPLGAILNGAEFALLCEEDPDVLAICKRALEDNVKQARRCGKIVRNVLKFSRDEPTEKWHEDVSDVVRRACRVTAGYASERGAQVEFGPCDPCGQVWMSPIEIEQALVNVIRNAIEARLHGGQVEVSTSCAQSVVRIQVRDDGRGIEPEALKHIFDPFYTTRLSEGGTGLGLSVANGVIADHRGTITAESEPGRGTTVTIELPIHTEA
jgi:signal transduction histidine kinase